MLLPNFDFEMTYWKARRRLMWMRAGLRFRISQAIANAHLTYLHRFGRMPEPPSPEESLVYRLMWAVVVIGTAVILAIECTIGEQEFLFRAEAVWSALQGNAAPIVERIEPQLSFPIEREYRATQETPTRQLPQT